MCTLLYIASLHIIVYIKAEVMALAFINIEEFVEPEC